MLCKWYHEVRLLDSVQTGCSYLYIEILERISIFLYGCETWSLTLKEEQRLRMFENRGLRRIIEARRDGVTGEWRKIYNGEPNDLYCSPNILWVIKLRRM